MLVRRSFLSVLAVAMSTIGAPAISHAQVASPESGFTSSFDGSAVAQRRVPSVERGEAEPFARTELFFGTATPDGVVTPEQFQAFLDEVVTPLFPDGLTVIKGEGQFRGGNGITVKEDAFLLILLYPFDQRAAGSKSIEHIRAEYVRRHRQESVLRVDESFVSWVRF